MVEVPRSHWVKLLAKKGLQQNTRRLMRSSIVYMEEVDLSANSANNDQKDSLSFCVVFYIFHICFNVYDNFLMMLEWKN